MKNRSDFYSVAAKLQTGISLNPGLPFTHTTGSTLANSLTVALAKEAAYQAARQACQAAYAAQHNVQAAALDFVSKARGAVSDRDPRAGRGHGVSPGAVGA